MKKLMIAVAIALAAVASQAATAAWNSGAILAPGADGTKIAAPDGLMKSNTSVAWYVFTDLTDSQYTAAQTAGTVFGWLSETPAGATKLEPIVETKVTQGTKANAQMNSITTDKYSANDAFKWASIVVYDDGSKVWYVENYGADQFDSQGSTITKGNLFTKNNLTSQAITAWSTQSVPEPTSGLLLLLGVAGLALKRRRA